MTRVLEGGNTASLSRPLPSTDRQAADDRRERWLAFAGLALFAVIYTVYIAAGTFRLHGRLVGSLFDDALISLRYAQHLVGRHGLVWNVGERPPIEGYTDLGWLLVMAVVAAVVPYDMAPIGVSVVGGLLLLLSGVVTRQILRDVGASPRMRLVGMCLVLATYPTVFWTLRGLEVGALALLLLLATRVALARDGEDRGVNRLLIVSSVSGLALLTRNDAVLLFLPVLAWAARRQRRLSGVAAALLPLGACAVGQLLFRYVYYGSLTPNTYVLKMTGVDASTRLAAGVVSLVDTFPAIAPAVLIVAVAAFAAGVPMAVRECARLALAALALQWAYLTWIGGDAWLINYSNRFIATVLPVLLVAATAATPACLDVLWRSRAATIRFTAVGLALVLVLGAHHPHTFGPGSDWLVLAGWLVMMGVVVRGGAGLGGLWRDRMTGAATLAVFLASSAHGWIGWTRDGAPKGADDIAFARLGLMLHDSLPANGVIAAGWVGAPAYFSQLESVDLLGKTDAHVARVQPAGVFRPGHNKMDLAYSVGRLRPHVVVLDAPVLATYGYRRLPNGIWLRGDMPASQDAVLGRSWCTSPSDSVYCPDTPLRGCSITRGDSTRHDRPHVRQATAPRRTASPTRRRGPSGAGPP